MTDNRTVSVLNVLESLRKARIDYGEALSVEEHGDWEGVIARLEEAAVAFETGRTGTAKRLVGTSEAELRVRFGRRGGSEDDAIRLAALGAARNLDRDVFGARD